MTLTKILVPTCLYCLNCTKFGQLILRKIIKIIVATMMSDFKAKMHQIRFRLGLRPRSRSPDPLAGFKGAYTSKGRKGRERREGRGEKKGKGVEGAFKFLASERHRLSYATGQNSQIL